MSLDQTCFIILVLFSPQMSESLNYSGCLEPIKETMQIDHSFRNINHKNSMSRRFLLIMLSRCVLIFF